MTRFLSGYEQAALDRAIAKRTGRRVRVGRKPLTRAEGVALWNAANVFEIPIDVTRCPAAHMDAGAAPVRRAASAAALLAATASLGACATLGGNVKGSFACRAPDGMCAPTTTIDDAALAMIGGDAAVTPAGSYNMPAAAPRMIETVAAEPVRSNEKVLRIVFPAHIDASGRFREASAIHAVVERGQWMAAGQVQAVPVRTSAVQAPAAMGEQLAMATPPASPPVTRSLGELASSAPEVRFPDPVAAIDAENAAADADAVARVPAPIVKPANALAAKPVTRRGEAVALSGPAGKGVATVGVGTGAVVGAVAGAGAAPVTYSLPPKSTVNPLEAIKAQVAAQLRGAGPVARLNGPQTANAASVARGTGPDPAAKPVNGPSLFPVSEVKP